MIGRTTFVIAHRLSTVDYADRIVVIADGEIAEEGKQKELLNYKGEYYKLYTMQYSNKPKGESSKLKAKCQTRINRNQKGMNVQNSITL